MKGLLRGFKLSLTSYISLAFIFFLFISAGTLITVNYYRMSESAFDETLQKFDLAIKRQTHSFQKHLTPAALRLQQHISKDKWHDFSAYINDTALLDELANYLAIDPLSNAVHFGFKNGNFVSVKQLLNEADRQQYKAPIAAVFVFEILEYSPDGQSKVIFSFLNSQLDLIGSPIVSNTSYKVFSRPWYLKGLNAKEISVVAPYQEYEQQHRIISLVLSDTEVVSAIDFNVQAVSELMQLSQVTENDLQIILNSENEVLAYQYSGDFTLITMDEPVASANKYDHQGIINFADNDKNQQGLNEFSFNGQVWVAKIALLHPQFQASAKLLIATPKAKVIAAVRQSLFDHLVISAVIILCFIPITWLFARVIVRPIHRLVKSTHRLASLQFNQVSSGDSFIEELNELEQDMLAVSNSLQDTFSIINMLATEKDIKKLAKNICSQGCEMLKADAAFIYRADKKQHYIWEIFLAWGNGTVLDPEQFTSIDSAQQTAQQRENFLQGAGQAQFDKLNEQLKASFIHENIYQESDDVYVLFLPLEDRDKQVDGFLGFTFTRTLTEFEKMQYKGICTALSKFISVAFESNELLENQERLLKSFIHLIAGAIDTKSPYTGAHCQRVPTLTMMLAEQATKSTQANLKSFSLTDEQWYELKTAAWLHDCGKVTTPENVVDKATKLETIYNRIHEVRMRFEVLRRDVHIHSLEQILAGKDRAVAEKYLANEISALEEDFAFIARCNLGEEMMSSEAITRINQVAQRQWLRYFDDTLGLSQAEKERKPASTEQLPVREFLLEDKPEHCIDHIAGHLEQESHASFTMAVPKYRFNLGELNNLVITRGTINTEERYIINHHIVQTIQMLEKLPFPDNLKRVPEIASAHHEQLNGKGYPKGLKGDEICIESRILTIADIFEALTASDRPYKEAKSLSQSIAILDNMRKGKHIDNDLFELFLSSGVYLDYAEKFLTAEQIDEVDIKQYLST